MLDNFFAFGNVYVWWLTDRAKHPHRTSSTERLIGSDATTEVFMCLVALVVIRLTRRR